MNDLPVPGSIGRLPLQSRIRDAEIVQDRAEFLSWKHAADFLRNGGEDPLSLFDAKPPKETARIHVRKEVLFDE